MEILFLRYEFRRFEENCTWSSLYQLVALYHRSGNIESYTVSRFNDEISAEVSFVIAPRWYDWKRHKRVRKPAVALAHLKKDSDCEIALWNKTTSEYFAFIYKNGGHFCVEWNLCYNPWIMVADNLSFRQIETLVDAVRQHGTKGLEEAIEWRQFDFGESHRKDDILVPVDEYLCHSMQQAKKSRDEMVVKTIQAFGIGDGKIEKPYSIRIAADTLAAQRREIFYKAVNERNKVKASKLFAMLAIRGDTWSRSNLGYQFHFGFGVPVDYDLAIFWHTLAAEVGDAKAMINLGKIYSEKNSPKWDGRKAIEWFEKAVIYGETWSMGELGHCLLCGKCAGKDVVRACSLLEKAVAENPDRKDFKKDLDRARKELGMTDTKGKRHKERKQGRKTMELEVADIEIIDK